MKKTEIELQNCKNYTKNVNTEGCFFQQKLQEKRKAENTQKLQKKFEHCKI